MDRVDYQSLIIQDLVNDNQDRKLNLNPWYQRRSVWTRPQKAYLINTLFERKPIPAIYIRHSIDLERSQSIKEIVDGQQRARAILEYCAGDFTAKMSARGERRAFGQLNPTERERFLLTPLPVGYLLGADDTDVIDIFARINSVSKTLNSQEKRNARFSGEFKQFCLSESTSRLEFWRNIGVFTANDIARMNEVQFVSDLIRNFTNGLSDFSQAGLDRLYEDNEEDFEQAEPIAARLDAVFETLFELDREAITDTIFRRQPVLFSLMVVLDREEIRDAERIQEVMYAIDAAFEDDDVEEEGLSAFRRAVTSSTQRIASRRIRDGYISQSFA